MKKVTLQGVILVKEGEYSSSYYLSTEDNELLYLTPKNDLDIFVGDNVEVQGLKGLNDTLIITKIKQLKINNSFLHYFNEFEDDLISDETYNNDYEHAL